MALLSGRWPDMYEVENDVFWRCQQIVVVEYVVRGLGCNWLLDQQSMGDHAEGARRELRYR